MKADFQSLLAALPQTASANYPLGTPFVSGMAHGSMRAELFVPACSGLGHDIQQPHTQDELYVVQGGRSIFCLCGERLQVQIGDLLFVPAGAPHHFEDFSPDFVTWVIFTATRVASANQTTQPHDPRTRFTQQTTSSTPESPP